MSKERFKADPLLGPIFDGGLGGSMVVSARTPTEMNDLDEAGLSVWLYRLARDPELLNMPPRRTGVSRQLRPERARRNCKMRQIQLPSSYSKFDIQGGRDAY